MKLSQSRYHFIAKRALTTPGLRRVAQSRLVDLHVDVFTDWSAPGRAAERQRYLSVLSDALVDAYREGIEAGRPEAGARERVHVMANLAFHERGWTELLEFPPSEFGPHLERHREFLDRHDVSRVDPTGDFRSAPLPPAPTTPERAEHPDYPHADPGYADDVYVERPDGEVRAGAEQPEPPGATLAALPRVIPELEAKYDVSPTFSGGDGAAEQ